MIVWLNNYLCNQCQSPLKLWVRNGLMTMCTRYNWLATGQCFFPGISVSFTNKTGWHNITEILLKVVFNKINQNENEDSDFNCIFVPVSSQDLDFQCHMSWSLFVFSEINRKVIVPCVNIDGFDDQHCLNFLSIIMCVILVNKKPNMTLFFMIFIFLWEIDNLIVMSLSDLSI